MTRDEGRSHKVELVHLPRQHTAVIRARIPRAELSRAVPAFCGEVWEFARTARLKHPGRHLALYLDDAITLECGVEVATPFPSTTRVACSSLPVGWAATTVHLGGYEALGQAHHAIRAWCEAQGKQLAGPNWEVYGHWVDPPARPRTDVYYLLAR